MRTRSPTKQRVQLARITDEIIARKASIAKNLHGIGARLREVQREQLWRTRYHSFEDYLARAVDISRATAYRFMRIADHFNATIPARYGPSKLQAALRYMTATRTDESPGDVLAADILIRDSDGSFRSVPLHEASASEIDEATRMLKDNRGARRRTRLPARWKKRAARLAKRLPPPPSGTARGDRVRLKRGRDGRIAISFSAIPVDELDAFIDAIRQELRHRDDP